MITYNPGNVILVPFPFTDQSIVKKRPAVVISNESYNQGPDVIIMAITSQSRLTGTSGEIPIRKWQKAGLLKESVVKPVITTIEKSLIIRKLGSLDNDDRKALRDGIREIIRI